jgi:hypothetical protein
VSYFAERLRGGTCFIAYVEKFPKRRAQGALKFRPDRQFNSQFAEHEEYWYWGGGDEGEVMKYSGVGVQGGSTKNCGDHLRRSGFNEIGRVLKFNPSTAWKFFF